MNTKNAWTSGSTMEIIMLTQDETAAKGLNLSNRHSL
jgi:hypothetical protein